VLPTLHLKVREKDTCNGQAVVRRVYPAAVYTDSFRRRTDSARLGGGFKARRRTKVPVPNTDDVSSFM